MNEVGIRLEEVLKAKFGPERGWLKKAAEALGLNSSGVKKYTGGVSKPGHEMQAKLRALGADVEYIMTGKRNETEDRVKKLESEFEALKNEIRESTPKNPVNNENAE